MKAEGAETEAAEAKVGGASAAMLKAEAAGAAELKAGAAEAAEMEVGAAVAEARCSRLEPGRQGFPAQRGGGCRGNALRGGTEVAVASASFDAAVGREAAFVTGNLMPG